MKRKVEATWSGIYNAILDNIEEIEDKSWLHYFTRSRK